MRLSQIVLETKKPILETNNSYLYEGLTLTEARSLNLWESAGRRLVEAELTSDQIQQLFAEIEKGATAGGGNRTMVGKGKDAAVAVNKAWEDLKGKIQDSGPIKAVDQKFDDAVAKIEAGLGGPDNKVNQVIQKYRKFAKDRPISQSLIYAALIAAAGISGAGLGGAAVLGLLKMTDKLLQGEKFSSAAYAGGKTGALAYGAGQIGQAMKGGDAAGSAAPKDSETFGLTGKADNSALAKDMTDNPMLAQRAGVSNVSAATDAASSAVASSPVSSIDDKNAKYAWQLVQQKIDAGELKDPKALSSELNKSLNKAFSDYGLNPNSAEAEASKKIAKDVILKSKDLETLHSTLSGTDAADAGKAATKTVAKAATDAAAGSDPFTVGGKTMPPELRSAIMKMPDADGEKTYSAWRMMADENTPRVDRINAEKIIDQMEKKHADLISGAKTAATDAAPAATDTAKAGGKAVDAATNTATANDPFVVNGKRMPQALQDKILKMPGEDSEKAYGAWKVLVGDQAASNIKASAGAELEKLLAKHAAKKAESLIYQTRPLSEGQVYLLFDRVVENNVRLINEGVVVTNRLNEGPMDFLKKAAGKTVSKLSSFGKNLTTKVTASKLLSAWKKEGSPTDSEKLNSFLSAQGVAPEVIQSSFKSMNIQPPTGKTKPEADSSAAAGEKQAPADTDSATQDQSADQADTTATDQQQGAASPTQLTKDKPAKGQEVTLSGKKYQWLGAQWAEVNPKTGKTGKVAEKGIVKALNDLAGVEKSQAKPASAQDQTARDTTGTAEKPAAPAGTIGLAQQGSGTGSATAPADDQAASSTAAPADDQAAPTAAKAAPAVGKVDVIGLAKTIKQQKPPVVDAIKKLLNSREAQRAD